MLPEKEVISPILHSPNASCLLLLAVPAQYCLAVVSRAGGLSGYLWFFCSTEFASKTLWQLYHAKFWRGSYVHTDLSLCHSRRYSLSRKSETEATCFKSSSQPSVWYKLGREHSLRTSVPTEESGDCQGLG